MQGSAQQASAPPIQPPPNAQTAPPTRRVLPRTDRQKAAYRRYAPPEKPPVVAKENEVAFYEFGGPTLLARTPAKGPDLGKQPRVMPGWETMKNHLESRLYYLRSARNSFWVHWQLLAEYILPRRSLWLTEGAGSQPVPNSMIRGRAINQSIIDPTGTQAAGKCAAGLMSGLASPSRPWFKLKAGLGIQPDREGEIWLSAVEQLLYDIMAGSNFYTSLATVFADIVVFGTGCQIIYEHPERVVNCYVPCVGEYYLAAGADFTVESMYRQFTLTVAEMVEMFKLENCPPEVQQLWESKGANLEVERIVAHAIEPNFAVKERGGDGEVQLIGNEYTWREVYWVWGASSEWPLSLRGFGDNAPFIAPRYFVTGNDAYGRSIGMDVLPDILQLQTETLRKAEALEKQVRPPLLASIEMKSEPSSILPGHVTYVAGLGPDKGMRPTYTVSPDLRGMMEDLQAIQQRIKSGFFEDLFLLLTQGEGVQPKNELELTMRRAEALEILGPFTERFEAEAAAPAVARIFEIAKQKKLLPPVPKSLSGIPIAIEFTSTMRLAQKGAATAGMGQLLAIAGSLAQADPTVLDRIDGDTFIKKYADLLGTDPTLLRSDQVVQAIRQQRMQAQQHQQQMAQMTQGGMAAVQGAQALANTPIDGGVNALNVLTGIGPQPGGA